MKKAIVLGANGFLGKNLTKHLLTKNVEVCALVQKGSWIDITDSKLTQIEFELSEINELKKLIHSTYDILFHFAWIGVSSIFKNDLPLQSQNLKYLDELFNLAQSIGVKKIICPGTASEYGCSQEVITGHNTPSPSDAYSRIKLQFHEKGDHLSKEKGVDFIWTLISTAYGPDRNDNNLIHYTITSLLSGKTPEFTGLEQLWDYIYIDDLVEAFYLLGQYGKGGKVYPIGYGESRPLYEFVKTIRDKINPKASLSIGVLPYKNGKIDNQIIDISELVKDAGFKPHIDFCEGIEKTILSYL